MAPAEQLAGEETGSSCLSQGKLPRQACHGRDAYNGVQHVAGSAQSSPEVCMGICRGTEHVIKHLCNHHLLEGQVAAVLRQICQVPGMLLDLAHVEAVRRIL